MDDSIYKVRIYLSDSDKLKILGQLLSSKPSRDIMTLLATKEAYTAEISRKLNLSTSLVIHHLRKMEDVGLVEISHRKSVRKGKEHRFFKIPTGILIIPRDRDDAVKENIVRRILKSTIKFASVGAAAIISHWIFGAGQYQSEADPGPIPLSDIPYIVVIAGLVILLVLEKKKKGGRG